MDAPNTYSLWECTAVTTYKDYGDFYFEYRIKLVPHTQHSGHEEDHICDKCGASVHNIGEDCICTACNQTIHTFTNSYLPCLCAKCGNLFHDMSLWVEASEATCFDFGYDHDHWKCKNCFWREYTDENGQTKTPVMVYPFFHQGYMTHHPAADPTCTNSGTKEYWSCGSCKKNFLDSTGNKELTDLTTLTVPADPSAHPAELTYHEGKAATCTDSGAKEYWSCGSCKKNFSDKDGKNEIAELTVPADPSAHPAELTYHEGKAATCTDFGWKEYWSCGSCKKIYGDAGGKNALTEVALIGSKGHSFPENQWSYDENEHWQSCRNECNTEQQRGAHSMTNRVVLREPDETGDGYGYDECDVCGYQDDFTLKYVIEPPKTGDADMPLLWVLLCLVGAAGMLGMRKRNCNR